ncbi:MAG: hypothetical protein MZV70_19475 [Desulfobacterales bacterium]|nr:hypothetical protein [Desulfobacterales bacterium]
MADRERPSATVKSRQPGSQRCSRSDERERVVAGPRHAGDDVNPRRGGCRRPRAP